MQTHKQTAEICGRAITAANLAKTISSITEQEKFSPKEHRDRYKGHRSGWRYGRLDKTLLRFEQKSHRQMSRKLIALAIDNPDDDVVIESARKAPYWTW